MSKAEFSGILISDFNTDIFKGYLNNSENLPLVKASSAPFGQVMAVLAEKDSACWQNDYDFALIWTQPGQVIPAFREVLDYQQVSMDRIFREVDDYARAIINLPKKMPVIFIPQWVLPAYQRGYGLLEMKKDIGIADILCRMNLRLSENLSQAANIYLLNTQKWIEPAGRYAFNPKLWYMARIAFGNEVFKEAVKDLKAALTAINGGTRKVVVLDLDNTLWDGIVGEVGWQKIKLGGHDPAGEACQDFQRALKALTNRGILLAVVSKNEEAAALEAINSHPEMVLRLKDFAGWRINWQDKARNILDLLSELNLGPQSAVFIDDSPLERARVSEALPEVLVPEWPEDKMLYRKTLLSLSCFDTAVLSREDRQRAGMYQTEQRRQSLKRQIGSLTDWLKTLEMKVEAEELNETNLPRAAQLLNKTNQMNLTTRRMTESELTAWAAQDEHKLWTFRVADKFGDYGLTGIVSLDIDGTRGRIADFILSCRVIGRKVEEVMLYVLLNYARSISLKEINAEYIPTAKNRPCLEFWKKSGFRQKEKVDIFSWGVDNSYTVPEFIEITGGRYADKQSCCA